MVIVLVVCIFTYILNRNHLQSEQRLESLVSRESSFLFNNLVLLTACFVILWGTLFPILSEYVEGSKVTVGAPFYNRVAVPIGLFLLFLTGVGPLLPWRSTSLKAIKRNFILPCIMLWVTVIVCLVAGARPWQNGQFQSGSFYALVAFALSAAVFTAIVSEFLRGAAVIAKQTKRNIFSAILTLVHRNTRRYGGYIIHIGVVIVVIGLAGAAFNKNIESELGFHDKMSVGPYTLVCQGFTQDSNLNYDSQYAMLDVMVNGKRAFQMTPEKRFYRASGQPQTMVAIHSTPEWDLYVVYEGANPDTGQPIIKAFLNPLVGWIWAGLVLIVLGTFVALVPSATPATASVRVPVRSALPGEPALKGGD
jgi:cytochrome c-type biogenesis protein CcmF